MKELLDKYPKATKVIKEYYLNKLLDSLKQDGLPEEFKNHVREKGLEDHTLINIVGEAPRMLIDVFDENEIIIEILNKSSFNTPIFYYKLNSLPHKQEFKTRKEAEKEAIQTAFEYLEDKL